MGGEYEGHQWVTASEILRLRNGWIALGARLFGLFSELCKEAGIADPAFSQTLGQKTGPLVIGIGLTSAATKLSPVHSLVAAN